MFIYKKFKIIRLAENPHWLFRSFLNKEVEGRISVLSDDSWNNYQIKHPNYNNWFDVPKELVELNENYKV